MAWNMGTGDHQRSAPNAEQGPAVTFATTEHFCLQTARAVTVSEANGRASIYLAALASCLVALAFFAQITRLGQPFYTFALILLPVQGFSGVVTFRRLVQSSIEDLAYVHRIGRLRTFYLEQAPELERYLVVALAPTSVPAPSAQQLTLTTAGLVAVVNSVVLAACVGVALGAAGAGSLALSLATGAVAGLGSFVAHERHHRRARDAYRPDMIDQAAILIDPGRREPLHA